MVRSGPKRNDATSTAGAAGTCPAAYDRGLGNIQSWSRTEEQKNGAPAGLTQPSLVCGSGFKRGIIVGKLSLIDRLFRDMVSGPCQRALGNAELVLMRPKEPKKL